MYFYSLVTIFLNCVAVLLRDDANTATRHGSIALQSCSTEVRNICTTTPPQYIVEPNGLPIEISSPRESKSRPPQKFEILLCIFC